MKNSKKMFILTEATLAVLVMVAAFLMMREKSGERRSKVSVIVQDSEDSQWSAFKYGLRMAAEDLGVELSLVSTEEELTLEEQQSLIENEIDNGADAVIVKPLPGEQVAEMLKGMANRISVMLVCHDASGNGSPSGLPVTGPDNYAMGTALAEELLSDYEGKLEGKTLGIFSSMGETEAIIDRRQGFLDRLSESGAEVLWSLRAEERAQEQVAEQPDVDLVAALDDHSLIAAGQASLANNLHGALVYGIGNSTEALYYLDLGHAECVVVPDEFNVGYQSLEETVKSLEHFWYQKQDKEISHTVIRRKTLFTKENQEILFTMNQ